MANLDEIQERIKSMADVVNAFKSEAVQLRVIEALLGQLDGVPALDLASVEAGAGGAQGRRTGRRKGGGKRRSKAAQEESSHAPAASKAAKTAKKARRDRKSVV